MPGSDNMTNKILSVVAIAKANAAQNDIEKSNTSRDNKANSLYILLGVTFNGDTVEQVQLIDRVDELELESHSHDNKSVLDSITQQMIDEISNLRTELDELKQNHNALKQQVDSL